MNTVRVYFETILNAYAESHFPVLTVAWEGWPFEKPNNGPYLEAFLIPAYTINPTVDASRKREGGIFQVNIVVMDGAGSFEADKIASEIRDLFPVVPKGIVSVEETPFVGRNERHSDGRRCIPVTVKYRLES